MRRRYGKVGMTQWDVNNAGSNTGDNVPDRDYEHSKT